MFGLWAALSETRPPSKARGGFTLSRLWDTIPGSNDEIEIWSDDEEADPLVNGEKWDPEHRDNHAVRGTIFFYNNITNYL
jgi:hypothetical protein